MILSLLNKVLYELLFIEQKVSFKEKTMSIWAYSNIYPYILKNAVILYSKIELMSCHFSGHGCGT